MLYFSCEQIPNITPSAHNGSLRNTILFLSGLSPNTTLTELNTFMAANHIHHLSDMVLRTVLTRPAHGNRSDGTPWPASTETVLISTVRLPDLSMLGGTLGHTPSTSKKRPRAEYETMVFAVNGIKNGEVDFDSSGLDSHRYGTAGDAFLGHSDVVGDWGDQPLESTFDALNLLD